MNTRVTRMRWIISTPGPLQPSPQLRLDLTVGLYNDGYSVEKLAAMQPRQLAPLITRFLGNALESNETMDFAARVIEHLGDLITEAANPPSEIDLELFIASRFLRTQTTQTLRGLHQMTTSPEITVAGGAIDPFTGMLFNPVMLQRSIEHILPDLKS